MGYSIDTITADCYEGTTCLINKFGITDDKQLSLIEGQITFAKGSELERNPIKGNFDFEHYKAIHKYLFDEIYEWAGKIRTVDMSKKGTNFAKANEIEKLADACFLRLKSENYFKRQEFDEFISNIVDFYCVTNMLHPFREGNGRTQRIFISQLIRYAGYDIDFSKINTDNLMSATIHAANGIDDFLIEIFKNSISK
jgi:cell filamentation protein